jgi:hypothetical protein
VRICRVDDNQKEIVADLRKYGVSVTPTHMVGNGFVDIVCGWQGRNYLFEIKDGKKVRSARLLTRLESDWHKDWLGTSHVIESSEQALKIIMGNCDTCI